MSRKGPSLVLIVGDCSRISCEAGRCKLNEHGSMTLCDGRSPVRVVQTGGNGRVTRPFYLLVLYKSSKLAELDGFFL